MQTVRFARDAVPHSRPTARRVSARDACCLTPRLIRPSSSRSSPSSSGRANRKLTLISAIAAIAATLVGGLWFAGRREQQPADAEALFHRGVDFHLQGKLDDAMPLTAR